MPSLFRQLFWLAGLAACAVIGCSASAEPGSEDSDPADSPGEEAASSESAAGVKRRCGEVWIPTTGPQAGMSCRQECNWFGKPTRARCAAVCGTLCSEYGAPVTIAMCRSLTGYCHVETCSLDGAKADLHCIQD